MISSSVGGCEDTKYIVKEEKETTKSSNGPSREDGGDGSFKDDAGCREDDIAVQKLVFQRSFLHSQLRDIGGQLSGTRALRNLGKSEPQTGTSHWEYLLREMEWMSKDFKEETKWKDVRRRACSKSALRGYDRMFNKDPVKMRILAANRVSTRLSREVTAFWSKIDRIAAYKARTDFSNKQQRAMDRQLEYLLHQTERYSNALAGTLNTTDNCTKEGSTRITENETESSCDKSGSGVQRGSSLRMDCDVESVAESCQNGNSIHGAIDRLGPLPQPVRKRRRSAITCSRDSLVSSLEDTKSMQSGLGQALGSTVEFESDDSDWINDSEEDDEGTIEAQDEPTSCSRKAELDLLKQEASMNETELVVNYGFSSVNEMMEKIGIEPVNKKLSYSLDDPSPVDEDDGSSYSAESEADDEETISAADEAKQEEVFDELHLLKKEAEMSQDEIFEAYGVEQAFAVEIKPAKKIEENARPSSLSSELVIRNNGLDTDEVDDDWVGDNELDDEGTIEAQDEPTPEESKKELDLLNQEASMDQRELLARYGFSDANEVVCAEKASNVAVLNRSSIADEDDDGSSYEDEMDSDIEDTIGLEDEIQGEEAVNELRLLKEEAEMSQDELFRIFGVENAFGLVSNSKDSSAMETLIDDVHEKNHVLSASPSSDPQLVESRKSPLPSLTYSVDIKKCGIPFMLSQAISLRDYQRAGLDWLVSLWEKRLNGILADEMGLGKTLQTIALLAHLASERGIWGPHLIVVPTSVLLNWETEFKRFCPGFKVVTYYGSVKERKAKRTGWSKPNSMQVCITSYQLAVQDSNIFKRKKWYYLILDEAHNIKNFQSQRWQSLLRFNSKRRLLLTGTPLQNSLMELWSLMHFLMPHIFRSQSEFKYWFNNPLNAIVEGKAKVSSSQASLITQERVRQNQGAIRRLHVVLRPFLLRRLKVDVATQLPKKYEHVVPVSLSRRQRFLYEDFISRTATRNQLQTGGYLGMVSVLMKLRMVCNHPDIFEPRTIQSHYVMNPILFSFPGMLIVRESFRRHPWQDLASPSLELDIGGDFSYPVREMEDVLMPGIVRTRRDAKRIRSLASCSALISTIRSIEFDEGDRDSYKRFNTFNELGYTPDVATIVMAERDRLIRNHKLDISGRFDATRKRLNNLERLEPMYGYDLRQCVTISESGVPGINGPAMMTQWAKSTSSTLAKSIHSSHFLETCCLSLQERFALIEPIVSRFTFATPAVLTKPAFPTLSGKLVRTEFVSTAPHSVEEEVVRMIRASDPFEYLSAAFMHKASIRQSLVFPDKMLVQYDCGKLQTLAVMLREKKLQGHRVLIFTQMTKMLDILEVFLNLHGHVYFRLDGSTKVDERQQMMEKFNRDSRIFAFILSTRSGGLGINLVGADTVIFYDSDWNPFMDAQAQDRAHRIGQTRDVHIYRLISEGTIEENILAKACQKRHLSKLSVEDGRFTVSSFFEADGSISDLLGVDVGIDLNISSISAPKHDIEAAMVLVEDDADKLAAQRVRQETEAEKVEFGESIPPGVSGSSIDDDNAPAMKTEAPISELDMDGAPNQTPEVSDKQDENSSGSVAPSVEYTQEQFKSLELSLKPVEQYAIGFRMIWFPVLDMRQAYLNLAEIERSQEEEWSLSKLEEFKVNGEDENEEEIIRADDAIDGKLFDVTHYISARRAIFSHKVFNLLTASQWEVHVDSVSRRRYYWNHDTLESTWFPPSIVMNRVRFQIALSNGWANVPASILLCIFSFAGSSFERSRWSRACRAWYQAAHCGGLYLWVTSMTDVQHRLRCVTCRSLWSSSKSDQSSELTPPMYSNELMTIGTPVEALYSHGEVWYPGCISAANFDGSFDIVYYDGYVEKSVRRSMLRLDYGARYNFVAPTDGTPPYGVFNRHYSSSLGQGPHPPSPRTFIGLIDALKVAEVGDVIVLRSGIHSSTCCAEKGGLDSSDATINTSVLKSLALRKGVRIVSEVALAAELNVHERISQLVKGEIDSYALRYGAGEPAFDVQRLGLSDNCPKKLPTKSKKAKEIRELPPPAVEMIGLEINGRDHAGSRHFHRMEEDKYFDNLVETITSGVNGLGMNVNQANRTDSTEIPVSFQWPFVEQTALMIRHIDGIEIETADENCEPDNLQVRFDGLAIYCQTMPFDLIEKAVKPKRSFHRATILAKSRAWFHNCTILGPSDSGSCVVVMDKEKAHCIFSNCVVAGAKNSGILVDGGGVALLNTVIERNGSAGIVLKQGVLLAKKSTLTQNFCAVEIDCKMKNKKAGVMIEHCDLRGNKTSPELGIAVPVGFPIANNIILDNVLLKEGESFIGKSNATKAVTQSKAYGAGLSSKCKSNSKNRVKINVKLDKPRKRQKA